MNRLNKTMVFAVIVLFISVSYQPMIAQNTKSVEKESGYNDVDFEQAKEYLFQTLIDISNNPEVKGLLKQSNQRIFTSDYDYKDVFLQLLFKKPRLLKSILFTKPKMTYEYLETNYNKGLEIIDILGVEETSKMVESVKITNPELFNELKIIIENDEDLFNRISTLVELNVENDTICLILRILLLLLLFRFLLFAYPAEVLLNFPLLSYFFAIPVGLIIMRAIIISFLYNWFDCTPWWTP